jgi:hypothetical protein
VNQSSFRKKVTMKSARKEAMESVGPKVPDGKRAEMYTAGGDDKASNPRAREQSAREGKKNGSTQDTRKINRK